MSPIQQALYNRRKKIVIGLGVSFSCLWLLLVMYLAMSGNKSPGIQPAQVAVHAPSPVANTSAPTAAYHAPRVRSVNLFHHHASSPAAPAVSSRPKASMGSTSMHVHRTSSASMNSIGSGGGGGGGASTGSRSSDGRGVRVTTTAYSGAIYIPLPRNAVTEVGASEAGDVSQQKMGITQRRRTNDGDFPEFNGDPSPDEDPPVPAGDVAWGLTAILAAAYGLSVYRRRKSTTGAV